VDAKADIGGASFCEQMEVEEVKEVEDIKEVKEKPPGT
jgi:hypothetical protein